eukprot:scaffold10025_cov180-Amphora_coffeaeformis.AAC.12
MRMMWLTAASFATRDEYHTVVLAREIAVASVVQSLSLASNPRTSRGENYHSIGSALLGAT